MGRGRQVGVRNFAFPVVEGEFAARLAERLGRAHDWGLKIHRRCFGLPAWYKGDVSLVLHFELN